MTDETGADAGGEAVTVVEAPADTGTDLSVSEAGRALAAARNRKPPAESADTATAEPELAQANDGPEAAPIEEPKGNDPEAERLPPIERPRSWSKDDDDEWNAIPRERQEKIAAKELAREADINQRISKAAEAAKAAEAKAAQAEQAKQAYEERQAAYTKALETALQADFGDIRTMDDVRTLQANDPFRFQAWQVRQMELQAAQADKQKADSEKAQKHQSEWATFVRDESAAFADSVPEYKAKKADYDTKAAEILREIGFTDDELNKLASGEEKIPLFDRRIQRLLFDRIKLSEIKSAPKAVAKPDLPPVVRPGNAKPSGNSNSERIQALTQRFHQTGDLKDAAALRAAQVSASSRRAS
jgi:hypothetical protein